MQDVDKDCEEWSKLAEDKAGRRALQPSLIGKYGEEGFASFKRAAGGEEASKDILVERVLREREQKYTSKLQLPHALLHRQLHTIDHCVFVLLRAQTQSRL